jgi:hypothetical protein
MSILNIVYLCLLGIVVIIIFTVTSSVKFALPYKLLAACLLSIIILEILADVVFQSYANNMFLYHIHNPIEYILFSLFFYTVLLNSKKRLILYLLPAYVMFSLFLSIKVQGFDVNNNYQIITSSILNITFALFFLREFLTENIDKRADKHPLFWISLGILLYFTGALFLEGFLNDLIKISEAKARTYYMVGFAFKYAMCILCIVGLRKQKWWLKYENSG